MGVVEAMIDLGVEEMFGDTVRVVAVLLRRKGVVRRQGHNRGLVDVEELVRGKEVRLVQREGASERSARARLVERRLRRRLGVLRVQALVAPEIVAGAAERSEE